MLAQRSKRIVLPAVAALAAALMTGCAEETPVQEAEEEGGAVEAAILQETVTLENEVTDILGPNVFTIGENDTPVIGVDAAAQDIQDGDMVRVTGTVEQIVQTHVESEWDWDFNNDEMEFLVEHELDLAVVADEVQEITEE